jgi:hypothetical protein
MSKEKSVVKRAIVPAHKFEAMLRATSNGGGGLNHWKDDLHDWTFSPAQLNQLISDLKNGSANEQEKSDALEIVQYIESKIKTRKD